SGALDTTFGAAGRLTNVFGAQSEGVSSVTVQTDGKIVVAGGVTVNERGDFALARFNSSAGDVSTPVQVDLTLNRSAAQSSTGFSAPPNRAINGKTDGNFNNGSVTHTNFEANPWWQVDLGTSASISSVVI